jgi:hypothetical protein
MTEITTDGFAVDPTIQPKSGAKSVVSNEAKRPSRARYHHQK